MDWAKYQNRHSSKYVSDQAILSPKWSPDRRINLAKYQLGHSYTFWTMPILIFSPVQIIMRHPLAYSCYCAAWPPGNSVGMRCFLLHNLLFMANLRRRLWRIPEDTYYIHTEYANITYLFFGARTWISATPLGDRMHLSFIHWFFFTVLFCSKRRKVLLF